MCGGGSGVIIIIIFPRSVSATYAHNNCVGPMINGEEGTVTRREYITSQVASVTPAHNNV